MKKLFAFFGLGVIVMLLVGAASTTINPLIGSQSSVNVISVATNGFTSNVSTPDMNLWKQTFTTNTAATILLFAPINVDPSQKTYQETYVYVHNLAAADRAIAVGSGNYVTNSVGTIARVTNWTEAKIIIIPGQETNIYFRPLN